MIIRLCAAWLMLLVAAAGSGAELLEPDRAFRFSARTLDAEAIEVRYQIAPGYYLYRDKFRFAVEPEGVTLGPPQLPPGQRITDEFFGEVETYRGEVLIRLPLRASGERSITLKATSQGCADVGVCYVPHEQQAQLIVAAASAPTASAPAGGIGGDDGSVARLFDGGVALLLATFFGFGLLLAFTPCVLPMLPILSGIIVGRGHRVTRMQGFVLSAAYVLGMAVTYAAAGVLAGLSGAMLAASLQSAWVLGTFALLFVALAGAMFGFYELQLPSSLQTRFASAANRLHGGHLAGVFAMGAVSALIIGPCVAAPLAGALLYISQSGDVVLGGSALFAMALGMGVPLLVVGASAGALMPKAGPWMETVKRFFGILLLGVAIYLVSPLVPVAVQMLAWAGLFIVSAVFMRALDALPPNTHGFQRFAKGLGVIALVVGIAFLLGALSGGRDVLQPLAGLRGGSERTPTQREPLQFTRVHSIGELDSALRSAAGRPTMLDFYADWCVSCKEMERYTFSHPEVRRRMEQLVKVQADVTDNTAEHQALLRRFRLFGPPGIVFFDASGREIEGLRVIGFQPADRFAAVLDQALAFR
jgi:thioredoxin:protein disulfide reductase